uniref:Uncharacterized protein n=1 Tax=Candidatus Kentrum sp. LFY TaxID=2126342 RepID=A0A450UZM8_9GAMM|nr:MAG: hypothetical protein BECKLFY1418B_GA0070995_11119 [Candidatus Kentron sp. LFY]
MDFRIEKRTMAESESVCLFPARLYDWIGFYKALTPVLPILSHALSARSEDSPGRFIQDAEAKLI